MYTIGVLIEYQLLQTQVQVETNPCSDNDVHLSITDTIYFVEILPDFLTEADFAKI